MLSVYFVMFCNEYVYFSSEKALLQRRKYGRKNVYKKTLGISKKTLVP